MCVAVACEETQSGVGGRSVFRLLGMGKPSAARAIAAYGPHIAEGSLLVHDRENAHHALVRRLSLASEAYDSRALRGLPDDENPLRDVNRLHFLLKEFLHRHSGFDRDDLPGWLDLFSVAMNPPADKLEKVAMVLDRAMRSPYSLRYRRYYRQNASSDGE